MRNEAEILMGNLGIWKDAVGLGEMDRRDAVKPDDSGRTVTHACVAFSPAPMEGAPAWPSGKRQDGYADISRYATPSYPDGIWAEFFPWRTRNRSSEI